MLRESCLLGIGWSLLCGIYHATSQLAVWAYQISAWMAYK